MGFRVFATEEYEKTMDSLSEFEQKRVERFVGQLEENAPLIGKPLRYRFFREKKFNGKRLYFLIYSEWNALLLTRISDKKHQPETIEWIVQNLEKLRLFVEAKLKNENIT